MSCLGQGRTGAALCSHHGSYWLGLTSCLLPEVGGSLALVQWWRPVLVTAPQGTVQSLAKAIGLRKGGWSS